MSWSSKFLFGTFLIEKNRARFLIYCSRLGQVILAMNILKSMHIDRNEINRQIDREIGRQIEREREREREMGRKEKQEVNIKRKEKTINNDHETRKNGKERGGKRKKEWNSEIERKKGEVRERKNGIGKQIIEGIYYMKREIGIRESTKRERERERERERLWNGERKQRDNGIEKKNENIL